MSLIVIKLGGSIITYKSNSKPRIRKSNIRRLAKEISQIYKEDHQIVLVHGSGYGHYLAKKYNLHRKDNSADRRFAVSLIDQKTLELTSFIINELLKIKLPAICFPPHALVNQSAGTLTDFNTKEVTSALGRKFIPVLSGEVVLDDKWDSSVLSGDITTCFLAEKLNADKIIFLTDVDGVFDSNPKKNKEAQLIPLINNGNINLVMENLTSHNSHDVSGEMKGKILSIQKSLNNKTVIITNGLRPMILLKALGQSPVGTTLHLG